MVKSLGEKAVKERKGRREGGRERLEPEELSAERRNEFLLFCSF